MHTTKSVPGEDDYKRLHTRNGDVDLVSEAMWKIAVILEQLAPAERKQVIEAIHSDVVEHGEVVLTALAGLAGLLREPECPF